jgi:hypothetical protein
MPFEAKLTGEAASLARAHDEVLRRLPSTVHAVILVDLQKWPALFPAEQRYQRALLEHLSQLTPEALGALSGGIARVETEAALTRISERDPARFQDLAQGALRKQNLVTAWRREVDSFFQQIDPALEARLYPPDAPRLDGVRNSSDYLSALFGGTANATVASGSSLFDTLRSDPAFVPTEAWIIESHRALHDLVRNEPPDGRPPTGLSYERLLPYRDALMRALFSKIQSGVESPQAFAAYARSLKLAPEPGVLLNPMEIVQAFVRDVLLTGNGTLFVNNTFVEWAAAQALRRAQPRMLVARYGVRDRLKPFSSLLLFSQPRSSDVIPLIEDPVGSFIDVEQLAYYVWVHAEKSAAYRKRTLYLFLAENVPDMLAIRSDVPGVITPPSADVSLADVSATIAHWLGIRPLQGPGRPIAPLVA